MPPPLQPTCKAALLYFYGWHKSSLPGIFPPCWSSATWKVTEWATIFLYPFVSSAASPVCPTVAFHDFPWPRQPYKSSVRSHRHEPYLWHNLGHPKVQSAHLSLPGQSYDKPGGASSRHLDDTESSYDRIICCW